MAADTDTDWICLGNGLTSSPTRSVRPSLAMAVSSTEEASTECVELTPDTQTCKSLAGIARRNIGFEELGPKQEMMVCWCGEGPDVRVEVRKYG